MNHKGQANSVFQLLIAAVVAGAILIILLQVLRIIPPLGGDDPNEVAANAVKSQVNDVGLVKLTSSVTFGQQSSLNARTIADKSGGLAPDQVCIVLGNSAPSFGNDTVWNLGGGEGQLVQYKGGFSQTTKLLVVCDRSGELDQTLEDYGYSDDISTDDCSDKFGSGSTSKVCLVAIISDQ